MAFPLPRGCSTTELLERVLVFITLWAGQDSNLRRRLPENLQSSPFAARDTDPNLENDCIAVLFLVKG